ncbi:uncharacterized protein F4822DRAFT_18659 [Hypoxylon trugodes]|uniref:uncharacterized protein n=1 Tax=Hypoxylon trugodes TaxID=326681 RepID=UPI0021994400|nr:uncharacterized protein F4822DRAFT_18659 [Hypoxylon trugodes]KAI1393615.1 hypothetical protein F4822DRAFT_18659 [Hypoxylon trugodes]
MTPEKARLMKAMKLREKKKMQNSTALEQTSALDKAPTNEEKEETHTEPKDSLHISDNVSHRTISHADSGIAIDPPTPMTINTEDTSDSHPNSPTAATLSEIGASTKASSLSESTDETVLEAKETTQESERMGHKEESKSFLGNEGLPISAVETAVDEGSQAETQITLVSDTTNIKDIEESSNIPEPIHSTQTTESAIRESIEIDDSTDFISQTHPASEENPIKSPWGLPVSKFSSNEPKTPTSTRSPTTSPTTPSLRSKFSVPDITIPIGPIPPLPDTSSTLLEEDHQQIRAEYSPKSDPNIGLSTQKHAKRKTVVGPIRTDLTKTTPLSEVSDPLLDDDLMDELQSATLQEAKPMLVSKSPITPVFPNSSPLKPAAQLSRTVSNPMRGPLLVPGDVSQSSARSVSAGGAAYLHTITRQSSNAGLQAKKSNLGSSISQRIKALEKLSGSTSTEDLRPKTATPSSTFFSVRKQSVRDPSRSPSIVDRASTLAGHTPTTPEQSREVTPETPNGSGRERRERSLSVASRLSMFESQSQTLHRGRPESIQVTARIIRDPSQSLPRKPDANANVGDYPQLELKQSPLVVDLQRTEASQPVPGPEPIKASKETIQERRDRKSISDDGEKARRRSSLSIVKDFIKDRRASIASKSTDNLTIMSPNGAKSPNRPPSTHQNAGGIARRLSISSRRSSFTRDRDNSSLASPAVFSDSGSGDDDKNSSDKKSKKRASRFIRRLSNSLSGNRKAASPSISPTVAEEDADQLAAASMTDVSLSQPAVVAYMGDVNVQFPDNLLWKRRSMCLDTQGFLFLSAVQGVSTSVKDKAGAGVKRYHLSDFRLPYIPDVEIQELPNSVVLDLLEGSCLQIACEDRAGQMSILHALQDAHRSHSSFGQ